MQEAAGHGRNALQEKIPSSSLPSTMHQRMPTQIIHPGASSSH